MNLPFDKPDEPLDMDINVLKQAWQFHQQGQHAQAEALYHRALADDPGHAVALYCYGRLALDVRDFAVAAEYLARAAAAAPTNAQFHADLAQSFQFLGRLGEAEASYRRALELEPNLASVHVNLGNTLLQAGRSDEAISSYRRALECDPCLADAHSCLGAALEQAGNNDDAAGCYRRAIELRPEYAQAHFNLGTLLTRLRQPEAAIVRLEKAVELNPKFAIAWHNRGVVLNQLGNPDEARQSFERALQLDPSQAKYHFNLGEVLEQQGRVEEALAEFDESVRLDPSYAQARCSRGTAFLKLGHFREGWRDYESRIGLPQYDTLEFPQPRWDGTPLGDQTLLVHCEQGLGDTFHFIRYVRLAQQRASRVIVASQPELIPLLAHTGYPNLVSRAEPLPPFDVHAPLLSLPHILGTQLENVPHEVPYLAADPALVDKWRAKLAGYHGFRIGIQWQGNQGYRYDRYRSIPLASFAPLARVVGVRLFSLQYGFGREQLAALETLPPKERFEAVDLAASFDDANGAFMDAAAVMQSLDLVITCDTAAAHLAGGLGVPVWVALRSSPEWRWMLKPDASPWYPTMRLFRQTTAGDWPGVFRRMAEELAGLVAPIGQHDSSSS